MRLVRFSAVLLLGVFLGGCASAAFWATAEQPLNPTLKPYQHLYVGWVPLREGDWQTFGYPSQAEWVGQIKEFNTTGLQAYVKEWIPGVKVSGPQAQETGLPTEGDLYIKFAFLGLAQRFDQWSATPDEMSLEVEFVDLGTKEVVYKATLVVTSQGSFGPRNWKCSTFDGRIDNTMYNLAAWLKERLGR